MEPYALIMVATTFIYLGPYTPSRVIDEAKKQAWPCSPATHQSRYTCRPSKITVAPFTDPNLSSRPVVKARFFF